MQPRDHLPYLALDALDIGLWARRRADQDVTGLVHHSDVQYRAIRYTERLAEAEAVASVGSKGASYDNAMAEALNSLFTAECIRNPVMRPKGGWKSVVDVEIAVAEYIDCTTPEGATASTGSSRPPSSRPTTGRASPSSTTVRTRSSPRSDPTNRASTKPGAIHPHHRYTVDCEEPDSLSKVALGSGGGRVPDWSNRTLGKQALGG